MHRKHRNCHHFFLGLKDSSYLSVMLTSNSWAERISSLEALRMLSVFISWTVARNILEVLAENNNELIVVRLSAKVTSVRKSNF